MKYRSGEKESPRFRSERIYCCSGDWYFASRENLTHGPYKTREEVELGLELYLRRLTNENEVTEDYVAES